MPRREDLHHILVIGSGPIVIGQACEFDYSGTQACRVLREEGLRVTLVNSNPATIMTDPEFADATYIEPITADTIDRVLGDQSAAGFPVDAVLATLGGQTALNTALDMDKAGILAKHQVELIGADIPAIERGEDRQLFKDIVRSIGGDVPRSAVCHSLDEVRTEAAELGLPVVIRPSYTMGGLGSGMAHTLAQLERLASAGLAASPVHEVLIEESVLGWKELELEIIRDSADNAVVICGIENVDPMGVHTGDSITVAPTLTLTDAEFSQMREFGCAIVRAVGLAAGGCNIQFAFHPQTGRMVAIEMNPRVSRSSALASKATGVPIAKIAAKLAIGYRLDEISSDLVPQLSAADEPTVDYVIAKVPRFTFEKFPGADPELTTTMKSVGEVMAIGRSFSQALGKALRSTETGQAGFYADLGADAGAGEGAGAGADAQLTAGSSALSTAELAALLTAIATPTDGRLYDVERALRGGASITDVHTATGIDPWFLDQLSLIGAIASKIRQATVLDDELLRRAKCHGLSDEAIAALRKAAGDITLASEDAVRDYRHQRDIRPVFKTVDSCSGQWPTDVKYHYSSYEFDVQAESEIAAQTDKPKVIILGSGPNRIGQGIEFDYSCVHAAMALGDAGFETVMINCNPETVSTDYDTADRLYFEPLTAEDVLEVIAAEQESGEVAGVIVSLGGQTPLRLAPVLAAAGVPIMGTGPEAIDLAEDRGRFGDVLREANVPAPPYGTAGSVDEALDVAARVGYPVVVRPSYVLGGRGMEIIYDAETLTDYIARATTITPDSPVLVDKFLDDAIEIDVDALCDGGEVYLGGVMEHIEEAGVHSGDSACVLPPMTLGRSELDLVRSYTEAIAAGCGVRGLLNVQYALQGQTLYVLEANPRASRTVPFSSKATGVALAKAAARIMAGSTIADLRAEGMLAAVGDSMTVPAVATLPAAAPPAAAPPAAAPPAAAPPAAAPPPATPVAVKEAVLPFHRFRRADGSGVDTILGPEMRSTGEVMGIDTAFGPAFAKSQLASYGSLPTTGTVFVSVANADKRALVFPIKRLADLGFTIIATEGTAGMLRHNGVTVSVVRKHFQPSTGADESAVDLIRRGAVDLVINTPYGHSATRTDGYEIRTAAVYANIPCITTVAGAAAAIQGIESLLQGPQTVRPLQQFHEQLRAQRGEPSHVG